MRKAISLGTLTAGFLAIAIAFSGARPASLAVVSVFENRCSSCHGSEGNLLDKDFEQKYKTEQELREMVASMPGATTLTEAELKVLVAYSRAISRREPFVIWTRQNNRTLEGEFAPAGATLSAQAKRTQLKVERPTSRRWRIQLPENVKPQDVEITIRYSGKRVALKLKDSPHTHSR